MYNRNKLEGIYSLLNDAHPFSGAVMLICDLLNPES